MLLRARVFPPGESESVEHGDETCEAEAGEGIRRQKDSLGSGSIIGASRSKVGGEREIGR